MSPKLVVVFGATGKQGGSVVDALLKSSEYYSVRAVTRNPDTDKARALAAQGVEVVAAFEGAYAAFGVTDFWTTFATTQNSEQSYHTEYEQGKRLADAAAATPTLKHYVWSTIPSVDKSVPHFLSKVRIDEYITSKPALAKITTYLIIGYYASNLVDFDSPKLVGGKYIWKQVGRPHGVIPIAGHTQVNCGLLVEAILRQPDLTKGKAVPGFVANTFEEIVQLWGKVVGREVEFIQLPFDEYVNQFPFGPNYGTEIGLNMAYFDKYGLEGFVKPGVEVVTKEQLGIKGWVGTEEAFRVIDWSSVLAK